MKIRQSNRLERSKHGKKKKGEEEKGKRVDIEGRHKSVERENSDCEGGGDEEKKNKTREN